MDTSILTPDDAKKKKLETTLQEQKNIDLSKTAIQYYDFANLSKENCLKYMLTNRSQFTKNIYNLSE